MYILNRVRLEHYENLDNTNHIFASLMAWNILFGVK